MKKYGHNVQLIFLPSFDNLYHKKVVEELISLVGNSEIIGISCMSYTSNRAKQLVESFKSLNKVIILGGIYATLNTTECLEYANFVCEGEGEEAILELINRLEKKKNVTKIKNLYTKKNNTPIKNPPRKLIANLDKLPFPDYDFNEEYILDNRRIVPLTEHHFKYGELNPVRSFLKGYSRFVLVHTTRGCPHSCSYCCNFYLKKLYKHKGSSIRVKSVKNVIEELSLIKKKIPSLKYIWFTDDSFFLRSEKEIEDFSRLYKKKISLPFMCYGDPLTITPNKLKSFVEADLNYIIVGVQTGSESLNREVYNRKIDNAEILRTARLLNQYKNKLRIEYQIIITNPYEKEEDLIKTINLLIQLPKPYNLSRYNLVFFPGSILYHRAEKDGLLKEKDDFCHNLLYTDFIHHLRIKNLKNAYLYYIIHSMGWNVTKRRYGIIPYFMLRFLINQKMIKFCNNSKFVNSVLSYTLVMRNLFHVLPSNLKRVYIRLLSIKKMLV